MLIYFQFDEKSDLCADILNVNCIANDSSFTGMISKISDKIIMKTSTCDLISISEATCKLSAEPYADCFYQSFSFWMFVVLVFCGMIAFNVSYCLSDAICFDILGDKTMKYGKQRVFGTMGYGTTALLSGIITHFYQTKSNDPIQSIIPALIIMVAFGLCDIISIKWLQLPKLAENKEPIFEQIRDLIWQKQIAIFLVFVTIAGILDSFISYYMFWYLEEVAEKMNYMSSIKLIEGCVIAAQCFGGEIIFLLISGKILKKIGYVHCLTLCFFMYALRFLSISMIPNPWWLIVIEVSFHGCSYALMYTCVVAYASVIAPSGTSTTVQALVSGMSDGVGYAIGSIIGGQMYAHFGGQESFRVYAFAAAITGIVRIVFVKSDKIDETKKSNKIKKEMKVIERLVQSDELEPLHCDTKIVIV